MHLTTLDWLIALFCLAICFVPALFFAKRSGKCTTELFASGRSVPWWLAGLSMVATTFSSDTPNWVTQQVRQYGVAGNWQWWAMVLTGVATVFFFARLWRRSGVMTDLEFYEIRYSGKAASVVRGFRAVYFGLFFNCFIMGMVTLAGCKIANILFGMPPWQTIVICGLLNVAFAAHSGLWGVLVIDMIQFFIKMTEKETRHWQPNVNYVPVSEATIKARLFAGEAPVGYTRIARYHFDYLGKLPRAVKFSLYEAPRSLKKFPADPADLKSLFTDLEPRIDLRSLPHVRLPAHKACLWEGTALFEKEGDYEFQLRSFDGTSQLFVDGNMVLDRTQTDWGQTEAKFHLAAGPHQIKVNFCGKSDFMTIGWRAAGGQKFVPLKFQEIVQAK